MKLQKTNTISSKTMENHTLTTKSFIVILDRQNVVRCIFGWTNNFYVFVGDFDRFWMKYFDYKRNLEYFVKYSDWNENNKFDIVFIIPVYYTVKNLIKFSSLFPLFDTMIFISYIKFHKFWLNNVHFACEDLKSKYS